MDDTVHVLAEVLILRVGGSTRLLVVYTHFIVIIRSVKVYHALKLISVKLSTFKFMLILLTLEGITVSAMLRLFVLVALDRGYDIWCEACMVLGLITLQRYTLCGYWCVIIKLVGRRCHCIGN